MAIDLISAIKISDAPSEDDFLAIQNAVNGSVGNPNHFSSSNPKHYLSSWEGYWNKFNVSVSPTSVGAGGGTVTVTYTTASSPKSGITPNANSITSNVGGSASSIGTTGANGQGTCKFTIPSRGTEEGPARTVTITVSYGNCKGSASLTQAANTITSEKSLDLYYWSQSRYSVPAFAEGYGDPDITYQVYGEYRFSSGAYAQFSPGVGLVLDLTYESKDKWGAGAPGRMWIRSDSGTSSSGYGDIYLGFANNYDDTFYTHYLNGRYPNGSNIMRSEWTQGTTYGGGDSSGNTDNDSSW